MSVKKGDKVKVGDVLLKVEATGEAPTEKKKPADKKESAKEEKKSEAKSDENLIVNVSELYLKETKAFTGFDFTTPIVDQLYLNTIFKPPIFS